MLACTACFNYHLYSNTQQIGSVATPSVTPSGMSIHCNILWCAFDTLFLYIFIGENGEKPSTPIIPIVVGVVGAIVAVLVLILLVVAVIFCYKKSKGRKSEQGMFSLNHSPNYITYISCCLCNALCTCVQLIF